MLSTFSCSCLPTVYLIWRGICSDLFHFLKFSHLSFYCCFIGFFTFKSYHTWAKILPKRMNGNIVHSHINEEIKYCFEGHRQLRVSNSWVDKWRLKVRCEKEVWCRQHWQNCSCIKEHGILEVLNKTLLCISKRNFLPGSETYKMH